MRIQLLSDLHFEFHVDHGRAFIEALDKDACDVLVLAGDVCTVTHGLVEVLSMFCAKFRHVVYVAGNHEFYGSDKGRTNAAIEKASRRNANLHALRRDVAEIDGVRFVGSTLWFPPTDDARKLARWWSDFQCVQGLAGWVFEENALDVEFLRRELRAGDVVVTHHMPSRRSVHLRYAAEATNCFFVCDVEPLLVERSPAVWMHGHTHESMDYAIGATRVVCNPLGYVTRGEVNGGFVRTKIVEVGGAARAAE